MSGHPTEATLNDYADGALGPERLGEVEAHVSSCAACAVEVRGLRDLLLEAEALPRSVEPGRDLWPGIGERIEAERVVPTALAGRRAHAGGWKRGLLAAAAAVALIAASSTITLLVVRSSAPEAPIAAEAPSGAGGAALAAEGLRLVADVERGYAPTLEELEAALEERREELQPATVEVIEENLRIIDAAIAEARAALEQDPANVELGRTLGSAYEKKLDLLGRAVRLPRQI